MPTLGSLFSRGVQYDLGELGYSPGTIHPVHKVESSPMSRDPSPSRMQYRMERIWLTPLYRSLIRTGLPIAIVIAVAANYFSNQQTQSQLIQSIANARTIIEGRPEFAVNRMRIHGASTEVAEHMHEVVPIEFPISSLRLDLDVLKKKIEAVGAIKTASLFLRHGVLEVNVVERIPALVWRQNARLELLDATGDLIGVLTGRSGYYELPLIFGDGAKKEAQEALHIISFAAPLYSRLRGLRRMGTRRWDMMLDRGQVIQLPVKNPVLALERVIALDRARDVLGRDVKTVDMRDGRRPTLRLSATALGELHRLRAIVDGDEES